MGIFVSHSSLLCTDPPAIILSLAFNASIFPLCHHLLGQTVAFSCSSFSCAPHVISTLPLPFQLLMCSILVVGKPCPHRCTTTSSISLGNVPIFVFDFSPTFGDQTSISSEERTIFLSFCQKTIDFFRVFAKKILFF